MANVRALFYDADKEDLFEIEIPDNDYKAWNAKIGCSICEIPQRRVGGIVYDFIVDEEFLYTQPDKPSAYFKWGPNYTPESETFMGNMIISKTEFRMVRDEFGDVYEEPCFAPLSDGDIANLKTHMQFIPVGGGVRHMLYSDEPDPHAQE